MAILNTGTNVSRLDRNLGYRSIMDLELWYSTRNQSSALRSCYDDHGNSDRVRLIDSTRGSRYGHQSQYAEMYMERI
jgi:hypothetical protein